MKHFCSPTYVPNLSDSDKIFKLFNINIHTKKVSSSVINDIRLNSVVWIESNLSSD